MKKQFLYIIILVLSSVPILAMNSRQGYYQSNDSEESFNNIYSGGAPSKKNQIDMNKGNNIPGLPFSVASHLYLTAGFKLSNNTGQTAEEQVVNSLTILDLNKGHLATFEYQNNHHKKKNHILERTIFALCDKKTVIGKLFFGIKENPLITRFGTFAMMVGGSCMGLGTLSVPWGLLALSGAFFKLSSDQYLTVADRYTEIRNSLILGALLGCGLLANKHLHIKLHF